ncbi:MAG: extracellular solute-binding protein [Alphaproteobacteria bacterium]
MCCEKKRSKKNSGCGVFFGILVLLCCVLACLPTEGKATRERPQALKLVFKHGVAAFGSVRYPKDFSSFAYVNSSAPIQGTFKLGVLGGFDSLNPYLLKGEIAAGLALIEGNLLHASLLKKSSDEPCSGYGYLAEGIHVSEDKTRVTFLLRSQAVFHDGSSVLPEDVIFTFNYLLEKGSPFFKSYYRLVERAEKTGDRQVTFILKETSNPEMPFILGQLPVLPRSFYQGINGEKGDLVPPLGSGPYRVAKISPGKSITYERVPAWWGDAVPAARGFYRFKAIRYDYFRDHSVLLESLKKGQIDFQVLTSKQAVTLRTFQAVKEGKLVLKDIPHKIPFGHIGFIFNTRKSLFQDPRVRQALGLVFDFEWINQNLLENSRARITSFFSNSDFAATGIISPEERAVLEPFQQQLSPTIFEKPMSVFVDGGLTDSRQRKQKALGLLKEAGWHFDKGKLLHGKTGMPFRFTFLLIAGGPFEKIVSHYREALRKKLGIQMDVRLVDSATFENATQKFSFEMILDKIPASYTLGNELWDCFGSWQATMEGSKNLIGIHSPVVDKLIEAIIAAKTYKAMQLYAQALDRVLMSGFYSVPAFYPPKLQVACWNRVRMPDILPTLEGYDSTTFWLENSL